jgi:hypothetical protein
MCRFLPAPYAHLIGQETRMHEERIEPVALLTAADGTPVIDFGKVLQARPRVHFDNGVAGRTVQIRAGYSLLGNGRVATSTNVTARVELPMTDGLPYVATGSSPATFIGVEGDRAVFEVGSGASSYAPVTDFAGLDALLTMFNDEGTISDRTTANLRERLVRAWGAAEAGSEVRAIANLQQFLARVANQVKGDERDALARQLLTAAGEHVVAVLQDIEDGESAA